MRFVKAFLVVGTFLFIIITLLSLLIPSRIVVSRQVIIDADKNKIYQQIVELKNWKNWHPVFMLADPKAIKFSTPSFGKDANCDILNNSKPTHLIFTATDSNSIKFSLATKNEEEIENEIAIIPIPNQAAQQVKWQSTSKLKWYPWEKFYGIFIDKLSGPGYEAALEGLKKYVE